MRSSDALVPSRFRSRMRALRSAGAAFRTFCATTLRRDCAVIRGWRKRSGAHWVDRHTRNEMASSIGTTKLHFRVLDGWRGIAALLVALFHLNLFSTIYALDFVRNAYLFVDFF